MPPPVRGVIDAFLPSIRKWVTGRYAVSIGGSQAKGTWDEKSDIDFRLYDEKDLPSPESHPEVWAEFNAEMDRWGQRGVAVDGIWVRRIDQVDAALDRWLAGDPHPDDMVWTIWGYHLPTDLYTQVAVEDPFGVIAGWKERLRVYPPALKRAILSRHLTSIRYWRNDYHYHSKVERGDVIFLAGLSAKLVHDIVQVLFALNETYYVGDGQNLQYVEQMSVKPAMFSERVRDILYPVLSANLLAHQRDQLFTLIDDVFQLASS